ncbi:MULTISPECIES: hypothetical protein [Chryseobacterium]|uniref:Uncharacterized protein n=1 Tax=Chryseobacterium camelliae TaxID=1265445 RepID=A0ABU0TKL2_9FLAO|nr:MULTISPECIES: hypothetical protein [Chryseobacterium]MDT3408568.1 hypothetical protein [Pseudacidovorax intermedius]MDQ1097577.1 hypothetical protein [Chryseobacterium camelliae]MDQ1101506.1 hypothetical protein [Chryseobacterium sp. SORGH_AS_1048]MDR6084949.1 hypothetical protein [Chryseobacterium sp. SORGH_AS_0909]MDR6129302.1 hypothetical protein [Chryseobacterium sp. SORGH_AS_1175]
MKKILFIIYLSIFSVSCAQNSESQNKQNSDEEEFGEIISFDEYDISMLRLIVTPEKYHNKTVQVIGYLNLEFEGNAIYFHQEDYEKGSSRNGMWVDFSEDLIHKKDLKKFNKKYVIIIGKFDMNSKGHMGMFGGSLKNISRLDEWH